MPLQWRRALLWAATLALATAIFVFSAQPGPASDELTVMAVSPLIDMILDATRGGEDAWMQLYVLFGTIARKLAHVAEYALLSLLTAFLMRSYGLQGKKLPIIVCIAYAVTDELHQHFVPGRLGAPTDVLIDSVGVVTGVFAAGFITTKSRRKKYVHDR